LKKALPADASDFSISFAAGVTDNPPRLVHRNV
jgi:hypothetical protein